MHKKIIMPNPYYKTYTKKHYGNKIVATLYVNPTQQEIEGVYHKSLKSEKTIRGIYEINTDLFVLWEGSEALHGYIMNFIGLTQALLFEYYIPLMCTTIYSEYKESEHKLKTIKAAFNKHKSGKILLDMSNKIDVDYANTTLARK